MVNFTLPTSLGDSLKPLKHVRTWRCLLADTNRASAEIDTHKTWPKILLRHFVMWVKRLAFQQSTEVNHPLHSRQFLALCVTHDIYSPSCAAGPITREVPGDRPYRYFAPLNAPLPARSPQPRELVGPHPFAVRDAVLARDLRFCHRAENQATASSVQIDCRID